MKSILGILEYVKGYWRYGVLNITFNILSAAFGLFSVAMLFPFLQVLLSGHISSTLWLFLFLELDLEKYLFGLAFLDDLALESHLFSAFKMAHFFAIMLAHFFAFLADQVWAIFCLDQVHFIAF